MKKEENNKLIPKTLETTITGKQLKSSVYVSVCVCVCVCVMDKKLVKCYRENSKVHSQRYISVSDDEATKKKKTRKE